MRAGLVKPTGGQWGTRPRPSSACASVVRGFDEVMVRHVPGDHALMLRSFELIGDQVIPVIRNLQRGRRDA